MTNKASNQCRLGRWIRAPLRFLCKARDLYVGFMYDWAEFVSHGDQTVLSGGYFSSLPINAFPSNVDNDLQDLIRANSKPITMKRVGSKTEIGSESALLKKLEVEILQLRQQRQSQAMAKKVQRMKCCEVIETIDEDKPSADDSNDLRFEPPLGVLNCVS
ncbi:hypothetical protein NE237_022346 [Protea cynaroides]|uniref:Uncharacterized protein n=1 Tax=Protea cynaroides TaxID=273540 RepID=A0A9Q0H9J2_9MAGN|nr:hypothetical protein NE237_022346 [Protea cynaroides]